MTSSQSPIQAALNANETISDLAHRCDALRSQRDFARRMAGTGWLTSVALGVALALLLSGCASAEPYYPGASMDRDGLSLEAFHSPVVVSFAPQAEVTAKRDRLSGNRGSLACASFGRGTCTVHIAPPKDHRDVLTYAMLHHELLHCAHGEWHE